MPDPPLSGLSGTVVHDEIVPACAPWATHRRCSQEQHWPWSGADLLGHLAVGVLQQLAGRRGVLQL